MVASRISSTLRGPSRRSLLAFTLVELLVVIAIIGILVAMLVPAVQSARESARRTECKNNLKQLGLAVLNYETAWQQFPASGTWFEDVDIDLANNPDVGYSWVVDILPHLDQQNLHDVFKQAYELTDPVNGTHITDNDDPSTTAAAGDVGELHQQWRSTRLDMLLCPSDNFNRDPFNGSEDSATDQMGDNWARGNYAANAALGFNTEEWADASAESGSPMCTFTHLEDTNDDGTPDPVVDAVEMNAAASAGWNAARTENVGVNRTWSRRLLRGIMGTNTAIREKDIRDGTTNTILLAEIRAGVTSFDSRGVWGMAGAGSSAMWAHGYSECLDDYGPNQKNLTADDIVACSEIQAAVGGEQDLADMGMPCNNANSLGNIQGTARSQHSGGVQVVFCDGSVHWISNEIQATGSPDNPSVWDRLMLSADGFPIDAEAY